MNEQPKPIRVAIYINGGNFSGVLADAPGVELMLVDYDNEQEGLPKSERAFDPVEVDAKYIEKTTQGIE